MTQDIINTLKNLGTVKTAIVSDQPLEYWYLERGRKTVVFIHGNSAGKEVFYKQFRFFSDRNYSLLAIDLPGHGGSADAENPEDAYTIPAYARIVQGLLGLLSIDTVSIVGWSLGGHIALEMVGSGFPASSIFITGTPPMGPGLEDFAAAFLPTPSGVVTTSADAPDEAIRAYVDDLYGTLKPVPEHFYKLAERTDGRARARMGEHWAMGTEGCPQRKVAAEWHNPIGIAHGNSDQFIARDYLFSLDWANLWGGRIHEFNGIGHAPFLEDPAAFNTILQQFLVETL